MPQPIFNKTADVLLDLEGPQYPAHLPASLTNSSGVRLQFVAGDCLLLRLWLTRPAREYRQPASLCRNDGGIAFALKRSATDDTLLAQAGGWELASDGGEHYEATFDLNTEEIAAAFSGTATSLSARLNIELQNPDNTLRITFASEVQIMRDSYQGTETAPVPATPAYPPPGDLITREEADTLLTTKVAAQMPGLIATAVAAATAGVAASIPRITATAATTLPAGSAATATIAQDPATTIPNPEDPDGPQIPDPAALKLTLGIPRGADGAPGQNGTNGGFSGSVISSITLAPLGADEIFIPYYIDGLGGATPGPGAAPPTVVASVCAQTPYATGGELTCTIINVTFSSFSVKLSAPVPTSGYAIHWIATGDFHPLSETQNENPS
jgi:hypothetical protein